VPLEEEEEELKGTLKYLRHVLVQSHYPQGVHYSCLLKLHLLKWPIIVHQFDLFVSDVE
jgi:hypothetical protein